MNLDDFSYEQEDRRYINPQVSLDEQNAFIDNLRSVQEKNNLEIAQDTRNLGTDVPSVLGGLTGSEGYFQSRYQTPQTNELVANLRATAQAKALNDVINNELAQAKQKYNNAYKEAKKRAAAKAAKAAQPQTPQSPATTGDVVFENSDSWTEGTAGSSTQAWTPLPDTPGTKIRESVESQSKAIEEAAKDLLLDLESKKYAMQLPVLPVF